MNREERTSSNEDDLYYSWIKTQYYRQRNLISKELTQSLIHDIFMWTGHFGSLNVLQWGNLETEDLILVKIKFLG